MLADLLAQESEHREEIANRVERPREFGGVYAVAETPEDHAALCALVVDAVAGQVFSQDAGEVMRELAYYISGQRARDEVAEVLRDVADGLYEYLDEKIDSRNAIIGLLRKYKQRSEWFRRERLRSIAREGLEGKQAGERSLAVDLHEYLLDQGVDFVVEPCTASGEPDLVLRDVDGSHIVVDAKHIAAGANPSTFKRKLADGFHQVQRYCSDFQEPAGYLVVFIEDTRSPRVPLQTIDTAEYLLVKGKQIFYIPVVIADLPSASKSGKVSYVDVSLDDLEQSASPI